MLKVAQYNGKEYRIDTTPEGQFARAEVVRLEHHDASGVFANVWEEATGVRLQDTTHYVVEDAELVDLVVIGLDYKFSRSKAYKRLYDWAEREWRRSKNG